MSNHGTATFLRIYQYAIDFLLKPFNRFRLFIAENVF